MNKILVINSSLHGEEGNSSKAAKLFVDALREKKASDIKYIDLAAIDLPHLGKEEMVAWSIPSESRSDKQKQLATYSDMFIDAIEQADRIIFAIPMYNFGIPSVLKAFFDRIARAGKTFNYTENGPVGLLTEKSVNILAARGGVYKGTPLDTQTEYVRNFLAFLGMNEVTFSYIEGLAMGEETATEAWQKYSDEIFELNNQRVD